MPNLDVHCNINEKAFSITVFLTRLVTGLVLLYISIGCLLYYREFLYNAAAIGLPMPVGLGIALLIVEMFMALFLLLGWFTRWAAGGALLSTAFVGFVFFASDFNKLYVALIMLLMAALLPAALLGPGRISLDFTHARRRAEKQFRG